MAKRRAKKTVKQSSKNVGSDFDCTNSEKPEIKDQTQAFIDLEVERRIVATQAIRDAEIQHLLTGLRLLRSNFDEEQLQTPVLQFFKENMPNLAVKTSEKDGQCEVRWKDEDGNISNTHADERNMHASLLNRMFMAYPHPAAATPGISGFGFSSEAGKTNFLGAMNLQFPDFLIKEQSDTQMLGLQDAFQTPGANSQRLSVGMTPKTLRLPKHGETILSVRGSPLGVYKEDNMEAIHVHSWH
ncbi:hypothetical protein BVC80_1395g4 [Macleaya cordata]|uniref:Borealin C-terminal domain-containing protein n=1 Tax=Macleaya cordata TaxID=56857 RepID=A0A200Q1G8_MACCD|nr:hypothetical protein BVC80_1395g4 [Macleaya cordata]